MTGGVAFQCKPKKNLLCYELGDRFSYRGQFFGCGNTSLKACIIYNTALLIIPLSLSALLLSALLIIPLYTKQYDNRLH